MTAGAPSTENVAQRRAEIDQAMADTFANLPDDVKRDLRVTTHTIGPAVLTVVGAIPNRLFNRVLNLGVGEDATEAQVDEILALYGREGVPFMVQLSPLAKPTSLPHWLKERGVYPMDNSAIFTRNLTPPADVRTELRVELISPEQTLLYAQIFTRGYGIPADMVPLTAAFASMPHSRSYIAWDGDTPVAAASMLITGRTARLTGAATLPEHRRQGGQGALLARRIQDAATAGCDMLTVETDEHTPEKPNSSYQNMLRLGFQLAYLQPNYVPSQQ